MDVGGAAGVVAGKDGVELDDAVFVGLLDTAEEGFVEVALVVGVAVTAGGDAGIDALE